MIIEIDNLIKSCNSFMGLESEEGIDINFNNGDTLRLYLLKMEVNCLIKTLKEFLEDLKNE